LDGEFAWEEAVSLIKRDTRRYIKRQLTWFSANPRIRWFEAAQEAGAVEAMLAYVREQSRILEQQQGRGDEALQL
jgi:tRNA dimethylallyltransferase